MNLKRKLGDITQESGTPMEGVRHGAASEDEQRTRRRKKRLSQKRSKKRQKLQHQIPVPKILNKSETPKILQVLDPSRIRDSFERVDIPAEKPKGRQRKSVPIPSDCGRTILVTNPHGTGFMHNEGMAAILVKFQDHQASVNLEPGCLYNLTLREDDGEQIEMLYFTSNGTGAKGEVLLLKWMPEQQSLRPIRSVAQGTQLDSSLYTVDEGYSWTVEGIYKVRNKVKRGNAIEAIRSDIAFLEKVKRNECKRVIKELKRKERAKAFQERQNANLGRR